MKTDNLFYRLLQTWPQLVLSLVDLAEQASAYEFISEEVKQTAFSIDGVYKPKQPQTELPLIFIEVQFQPDNDFYARFFTEIMIYLYQHKSEQHWLALVIYPKRSTEKLPSLAFDHVLNLPQLKRIYLEDFHQATEPEFALLRLIACPDKETADCLQLIFKQNDKLDKNVIEFIETILVYKLPNLSREEVRAMLGFSQVELKNTRFYQEIAEEERNEGIQLGKQLGKQEWLLTGKVELLSRQLAKRFPPLPNWAKEKLQQANIQQLDDWAERIFEAKSIEELFE